VKKKGAGGGGGGHDAAGGMRWLLTYADLITLLLVFFIITTAMANQDQEKMQKVAEALAEAFNPFYSDLPFPVPGEGAGPGLHGSGQGFRHRGPVVLMRQVEDLAKDMSLRNIIISHEENAVIDFMAEDFFEPGSLATLKPAARSFLDRFALLLQVSDQNVEVSAHVRAGTADPWGITSARAIAVVRYLVETRGVEAPRLVAAASGTTPHRIAPERPEAEADGVTFYVFGGTGATEITPPPEAFP